MWHIDTGEQDRRWVFETRWVLGKLRVRYQVNPGKGPAVGGIELSSDRPTRADHHRGECSKESSALKPMTL